MAGQPDLLSHARRREALQLLVHYLGINDPGKEPYGSESIARCLDLVSRHGEDGVEAFIRFTIPKSSGGKREIIAPVEPIKELLRVVSLELLSRYPLARFAHGFRARRSVITNAATHLDAGAVNGCNWDITDCFPSTDIDKIRKVFERTIQDDLLREGVGAEVVHEVVAILMQLSTLRYARKDTEVLPMGSPTSPALLNLVLRPFDLRLSSELSKLGGQHGITLTYTRYGDDMTVTSTGHLPEALGRLVPQLLIQFGYRVNRKKTIWMGDDYGRHIEITGLTLGDGKLILSDKWLKKFERQVIHYATMAEEPKEALTKKLRGKVGLARAIASRYEEDELPVRIQNCYDAWRESEDPLHRARIEVLFSRSPVSIDDLDIGYGGMGLAPNLWGSEDDDVVDPFAYTGANYQEPQ